MSRINRSSFLCGILLCVSTLCYTMPVMFLMMEGSAAKLAHVNTTAVISNYEIVKHRFRTYTFRAEVTLKYVYEESGYNCIFIPYRNASFHYIEKQVLKNYPIWGEVRAHCNDLGCLIDECPCYMYQKDEF